MGWNTTTSLDLPTDFAVNIPGLDIHVALAFTECLQHFQEIDRFWDTLVWHTWEGSRVDLQRYLLLRYFVTGAKYRIAVLEN
jgi:Tat protein secretion system quality control protein TatD with DNase activity